MDIPKPQLNRLKQYVATYCERDSARDALWGDVRQSQTSIYFSGQGMSDVVSMDSFAQQLHRAMVPEMLADRWEITLDSAMRTVWLRTLTTIFRTPREFEGLLRYGWRTQQLRAPEPSERVLAYRRDPGNRFSVRYRTFEDWAASRRPSMPDGSTGNITQERYQLMTVLHGRYPENNLEELNTLLHQTLVYHPERFGGLAEPYEEWRVHHGESELFGWESFRECIKHHYPLTPYWFIDDHQHLWTHAYQSRLLSTVSHRMATIFPVRLIRDTQSAVHWLTATCSVRVEDYRRWQTLVEENDRGNDDWELVPDDQAALSRLWRQCQEAPVYALAALIGDILREMKRLWGTLEPLEMYFMNGYFHDSWGFVHSDGQMAWLGRVGGITPDEDTRWLHILAAVYDDQSFGQVSKSGSYRVDEDETITAFLETLLHKYRQITEPYPAEPKEFDMVTGYDKWRRQQGIAERFSTATFRQWFAECFPLIPTRFLFEEEDRLISCYTNALLAAITEQEARTFPLTRPFYDVDGFVDQMPSAMQWLERHYAVTAHQRRRVRQFAEVWGSWALERRASDRTLRFLTGVWERYRVNTAVYPRLELIDAIANEIVRIFGNLGAFERYLLDRYDNPLMPRSFHGDEYAWLEDQCGISQEDDELWIDILMATYSEADLDPNESADQERLALLADEEAVAAFLRTLLERYRSCKDRYPSGDTTPPSTTGER